MSSLEAESVVGAVRVSRAGRLTRALTATPFLGAVVAIFSWPIYWIGPTIGPDPSWAAGLYMAYDNGLQFGKQFVFTYGPLGFLQVPALYDESLWMVAFLYRSFIHLAVAISLLWVARRTFPLVVAVAASYVLLVIGYLEAEVILLAFIWCVVALSDRPPRFALPLVVFAGGGIGAIELLGKANFGLAVLAFCAVALLGIPDRRRNFPKFAVVVVASLVGLWLLSGQSLSNVPDFASNAIQVISGYSRSMGSDISNVGWERSFAVAAMALLLTGAFVATRRDPLPRRLATVVIVALFAFLNFKQGFVRQGLGSGSQFFTLMLGGAIALAWRLPARLSKLPPHLPALALTTPLLALTIATLPSPSLWQALMPGDHTAFLRNDLHAFLSSGERDRLRSEGRKMMRSVYRLDRRALQLIGHRSVHVDPWEIGVAWAYGLNWRPLPAIQDYQAYTPALDELNADALSGPDGPEAILRQNTRAFAPNMDVSIDDRYSGWDPPAATLAMLCHYRSVHTTGRWQVLFRVTNRCGSPRQIGAVHSRTGMKIAIPPPPKSRDIVFARIYGVGVEGLEKLRSALYRAYRRTVTLDGYATWRLIPDTAQDGLIMRAPRAADYPKPFQLAPNAHRLSVQVQGGSPRNMTVKFFAERVGRSQAPRLRTIRVRRG